MLDAHSFARFAACFPYCHRSYYCSQTYCHVMQVEVPQVPCPDQYLHMLTTAESKAFSTTSTVYFDTRGTTVVINVTGLPAEEHYHTNFSINDGSDVVIDKGEESVLFSKCD